MSRSAPTPVSANMLAIAAALIFGFFLPSTAYADDAPAPPATVPTPTVPMPDPAPAKPTPSPAPRRQVSRTPAYNPPLAPRTSPPAIYVKPKVAAPKESKPRKMQHGRARAKKRRSPPPRVEVAPPIAAVSVRHAFQRESGNSPNLRSLLIVLGLAFAIACFTIALVPATYVKWRPAAIFVSDRQFDVTVVGLALLAAAACMLLWTSGP